MKQISRFAKSAGFAGHGIAKAWREEINFRWEVVAAVAVIIVAWQLKLGAISIAILIFTSSTVIALELINTMVELISDVLKPRLDQYVRHIKDLTAAAVAVAAIGSIGVAACLLVPPIVRLLWR